jgi:hypothetical protein
MHESDESLAPPGIKPRGGGGTLKGTEVAFGSSNYTLNHREQAMIILFFV